jgi:hypothetical protein
MKRVRFTEEQIIAVLPARCQARGCRSLPAVLEMSERRACSLVAADRKMIRYRSPRPPDTELRARLRELANQQRRLAIGALWRFDCQ